MSDDIERVEQKEPGYREAMLNEIRFDLQHRIDVLRQSGVIVEVRQVPLKPLAMGNYISVIDVRDAQEIYKAAQ